MNLRCYLEERAERVDAVLYEHRLPGRVTGGTVGPRLVRFFLDFGDTQQIAALRAIRDAMAQAMGVPSLRIRIYADNVALEFPNPAPRPQTFLDLLDEAMPLPPEAALLGITSDGAPLLVRFSASSTAHVLVASQNEEKSALLRSIALSLILGQHPRNLRLLCIDLGGRVCGKLGDAPHLIRPPVRDVAEGIEAVQSAMRLIAARERQGEGFPHLVVLVDDTPSLVSAGGEATSYALFALISRGENVGIHLVAGAWDAATDLFRGWMKADDVPLLITDDDGGFLAVGGRHPIRFRVVYVGAEEAGLAIRKKWLQGNSGNLPRKRPIGS